jgi:hypothetical protein
LREEKQQLETVSVLHFITFKRGHRYDWLTCVS